MSECFNKYFICNNNVKDCEVFDDYILKEGKSLYEVIRIIDGKPLFIDKHLKRFKNSAEITGLNLWLSEEEIKININKLIKANDVEIGNVKLIFNFKDNEGVMEKNFVAYFTKHKYPSDEAYKNGVNTILYHGERTNPNAKVINSDFRTLVDKKIKAANAFEAILVDRNGYITEGSKSNIFLVKDNKVLTAPLKQVLPGTTRNMIIDICKNIGLDIQEENLHYSHMKNMDGLFISGTSPKVLPIKQVDDMLFKSSSNEIILKIMKAYDDVIKEDILKYK